MKIHAAFDKPVLVHSEQQPWVPSPMPGVDRRALDRLGDEVARATTIVRYAPSSHFSAHTHTGGEEFLVLEGVFQDEHGDFPVGTYIRNPPESSHTPRSDEGCIIFVKLWQFEMQDRTQVRLHIDDAEPLEDAQIQFKPTEGINQKRLFKDLRETVSIVQWSPLTVSHLEVEGGAEILVLEGELSHGDSCLQKHSWLRLPVGVTAELKAGPLGAKIWMKTGHLSDVGQQVARLPKG